MKNDAAKVKNFADGGAVTKHQELATEGKEPSEPKRTGKVMNLKDGGHVKHHEKVGEKHGHKNAKTAPGKHGHTPHHKMGGQP